MNKAESTETKPRGRNWRLWVGMLFVAVAALSLATGWFGVDWDEVLASLQERRSDWQSWAEENALLAALCYFVIYIIGTGLSLPGAPLLTMLGGALFGFWRAVIYVSFASTAGATLAFLASRHLFRDWAQERYRRRLDAVNRELTAAGDYYLLFVRLNPVIPFFLINLLFGLTRYPATRFWWVSQIGMLPGTCLYVNAGVQLAQISSVKGIISWQVAASLAALGLFPLAASKIVQWVKKRSVKSD